MSYTRLVSQLVSVQPDNRTSSLHELCLLVLDIHSIEEKLTVQEEVNRSHSHGISELAFGKDWAIADSPAGSKKRYIGELPTTVNDGFKVTIRVTPNYIIRGKSHDLFRSWLVREFKLRAR